MYNTSKDHRPSRPFITSQRHANEEFAWWLRENDLHRLVDKDGLAWNLAVKSIEIPRENDLHKGEWHLTFLVSSTVSVEDFVKTGTLNPDEDERLISLLGDEKIRLTLKPRAFVAPTLEEARTVMIDQVAKLREEMVASDLCAVKRKLIGLHIDRRQAFTLRGRS